MPPVACQATYNSTASASTRVAPLAANSASSSRRLQGGLSRPGGRPGSVIPGALHGHGVARQRCTSGCEHTLNIDPARFRMSASSSYAVQFMVRNQARFPRPRSTPRRRLDAGHELQCNVHFQVDMSIGPLHLSWLPRGQGIHRRQPFQPDLRPGVELGFGEAAPPQDADVEPAPARSTSFTRSATTRTPIVRIRLPRWNLTVFSDVPNSAAICLLSRPATIRSSTCRSRAVNRRPPRSSSSSRRC